MLQKKEGQTGQDWDFHSLYLHHALRKVLNYPVRKKVAGAAMNELLLRSAKFSGLGYWMRTWLGEMNVPVSTSHEVKKGKGISPVVARASS